MSEQEKQLVLRIAKYVLVKSMNSDEEIVDYNTISKETNIPMQIIKSAASKVCKLLLTSKRVEDADLYEDGIDVLLKRKAIRI